MSLKVDKKTVTFTLFGISANQEKSIICSKKKKFHFEHALTERNLSFSNLKEEVKSTVMENYETECREVPELLSVIGFLGLSGFQ